MYFTVCLTVWLGAPFITLLEDSPEVKRRGLVVDPLRLSMRFDTTSLVDDATNGDSTHYDDLLCEGKIQWTAMWCVFITLLLSQSV